MTRWRRIAALFGVAVIISAFVLWLIPTPLSKTTVVETTKTTVINSTGHNSTTHVNKETTTRAPGGQRSDAMLVAVLTFGAGLLLAASLWNRIQELTIGGVSIKLTETAVAPPEIALDTPVPPELTPQSVDMIASEVNKISEDCQELVRVDLKNGDLWTLAHLSLFILLLAHRSCAKVVLFSGQGSAGPETYLGAAPVKELADILAAKDPALSAAQHATETMPLKTPPEATQSLGDKFDAELRRVAELGRLESPQAQQTDRVGPSLLDMLAGRALTTRSIETGGQQTLSKQEQRVILAFPLSYVPVTGCGRLESVVDKGRLAEKIALSAVGLPKDLDEARVRV